MSHKLCPRAEAPKKIKILIDVYRDLPSQIQQETQPGKIETRTKSRLANSGSHGANRKDKVLWHGDPDQVWGSPTCTSEGNGAKPFSTRRTQVSAIGIYEETFGPETCSHLV